MSAPTAIINCIAFALVVLFLLWKAPGATVGLGVVVLVAHVAFGVAYPASVRSAVHDVTAPQHQLHDHQVDEGKQFGCANGTEDGSGESVRAFRATTARCNAQP